MPAPNAINPRTGKRYGWEAAQAAKVKADDTADIKKQLALLKRQKKAVEARDDLLTFTQFTMPDPEDPNDVERSKYEAAPFHKAVARALLDVETGKTPQLIFCMPPRHGKLCADDTPVLTTAGWTTHGRLKAGDYVYGPDGEPTRVEEVFAEGVADTIVEMTNGEIVHVNEDHLWTVYDRSRGCWRVLQTREMRRRKLWNGPVGKRGGRATLQLPDTQPVVGQHVELPVAPYSLGVWLGDGSTNKPAVTMSEEDGALVVPAMRAEGYETAGVWMHKTTGVPTYSFGGKGRLPAALRSAGVFGRKHIPDIYFCASIESRLQLLAGLIDTDGYVEPSTGRVRVTTADPVLADDIYKLVASLAFRPHVQKYAPVLSTSGVQGRKTVFAIGFQPTREVPVRLPRKTVDVFAERRRIGVKTIQTAEAKPGRCIKVARADGLYLVGKSLVPTHNTEIATKRMAAWYSGRHPGHDIIAAMATDALATDAGSDVRAIIQSPQFKQVFPAYRLRRGGAAKDNIQTEQGGRLIFAGRGGTINGRGANIILCDDLFKDAEEAASPAVRDSAWNWFVKVALWRRMGKKLAILTMTRWHSDDIIGRLTDPENPHYNIEEAKAWKIIRLPGIAEEDDPLGRKEGEALWPEKYDRTYLMSGQRRDPLGFAALIQQRPSVADGVLFRRENIQFYKQADLPEDLRIYCSSDHAVGTKQRNDYTVMFKVGIDRQSNIWVLDCFRAKVAADKAVETMLAMASGKQKPLLWWAERGHISKSIGPFLRKRMLETGTYINMVEVTPVADKEQRAQSIAARVAMGKVYFPVDKLWTEKVVNEMLAFPNGTNDDAVDALAYIGLGLQNQFGPSKHSIAAKQRAEQPATLTLDWVKLSARHEAEKRAQRRLGGC